MYSCALFADFLSSINFAVDRQKGLCTDRAVARDRALDFIAAFLMLFVVPNLHFYCNLPDGCNQSLFLGAQEFYLAAVRSMNSSFILSRSRALHHGLRFLLAAGIAESARIVRAGIVRRSPCYALSAVADLGDRFTTKAKSVSLVSQVSVALER